MKAFNLVVLKKMEKSLKHESVEWHAGNEKSVNSKFAGVFVPNSIDGKKLFFNQYV